MPDKEKLVELLITSDDYENSVCLGYPCKVCPYKGEDCTYKAQADHLIANGVTVQDVHDTNVGEWISVKDRTPSEKGCYMVTVKHWLDGKPVVREAKWNGVDWLSCYKAEELTPRVTHWTYLPLPVEEDNHGKT